MSSVEFREQVEECYGSKIDEDLWQQVMMEHEGQPFARNVQVTVAVIRAHAKNKRLKAEIQVLKDEKQVLEAEKQKLTELVQQNHEEEQECFVVIVSEAATDDDLRNEFRTRQVGKDPCQGAFVCHRMFIEFAKASQLMNNGKPERSTELDLLEADMNSVEEDLHRSFLLLVVQ
jgi:hypothetical protein